LWGSQASEQEPCSGGEDRISVAAPADLCRTGLLDAQIEELDNKLPSLLQKFKLRHQVAVFRAGNIEIEGKAASLAEVQQMG
jgi:hypothetical protein